MFEDVDDYKILRNDWPYGLAPEISHLVVWLKNRVRVDESGDLTKEERGRIESFVRRTFGGEDRVLWFKNWGTLQSVRGIDHVHVLVRDVDEGVINGWVRSSKQPEDKYIDVADVEGPGASHLHVKHGLSS